MTRFASSPLLPPLTYALCLILSSANALEKYVRGPSLYLYMAVVVGAVFFLWRYGDSLVQRMSERQALVLTVLMLLGLAALFAVGYPLANADILGPGSDRDEAIQIATSHLLAGEYPYYDKTYLDNPISPLPGSLLLSIPFVLLGNGALQILFWIVVFLIAVRATLLDSRQTMLILATLLLLAPKVPHEVVTGSDFIANALYVLVAILWLAEAIRRPALAPFVAAAVFLGVALSSRANFLFLVPLIYVALAQRGGWQRATAAMTLAGATFVVITLPFWLYDPEGFSPLTTARKVNLFDALLPYSSILVPALMGLAALGLAWQHRTASSYPRLFRDCAIVQAIPVVYGVILPSLIAQRLILAFGTRYGMAFLFFAALAFHARRRTRDEERRITTTAS